MQNDPNEVTLAAMEAAEKGDELYGPFDSVDDLMETLNAETGNSESHSDLF
jgi:DNA-damage-inducible protein J